MNDSATSVSRERAALDETFQVTLKGLRPNASPVEARAKLAALFKASPEQVDRLVTAHGYVLKRGCTLDVATKYKNAIEATGAVCELVSEAKPVVSLDADLPNTDKPATKPPTSGHRYPVPEHAKTDTNSVNQPIDAKWQLKFALMEKAGGPKFPQIKKLSLGERMKVVFSIWGFLFGPFYYLVKGMWKKAISLTAVVFVLILVLDQILTAFELPGVITNFIGPAIFATRANVDYYKKIILGENGWW